jgi:hypothetical protein
MLEEEPGRDPAPIAFSAAVGPLDHGMYDCCPKAGETRSKNTKYEKSRRPRGKKTHIGVTPTSVSEYFKGFSIFHDLRGDGAFRIFFG